MGISRFAMTFTVASVFAVAAVAGMPSAGANNNDQEVIYQSQLFRDGSVSCTGADDLSRGGGRVVVLPGEGKAHFTLKLRNASPNTAYTLAVSEEPNCANAQFYPAETTDSNGNATFYGTYTTAAGTKNLLFNLVTPSPDTPRNREIATKNTNVVIPAPTP